MVTITDEYCKKQLKRVGQKVKKPRTILNKEEWVQYTFEEALEHASRGNQTKKMGITKDKYIELTRMLLLYKLDKPGACKELTDTFFEGSRWILREFTDRLAQRGWYMMSTERLLSYFGLKENEEE